MTNPRSFAAALARSWRSLRRRPAFFVIAVSSMAIALGLATAVIAEIDSLRHPYVPFRDPERVYSVGLSQRISGGIRPVDVSADDIIAVLKSTPVFERIVQRTSITAAADAGAFVGTLDAQLAEPGLLELLGVKPRLGRLFAPNETSESGVAIVSDEFWRRFFGNPASVDSVTMMFGGRTYRVIGVLPRGFQLVFDAAIVLPAQTGRPSRYPSFLVRIKPDVEQEDVIHALRTAEAALARRFGATPTSFRFHSYSYKLNPLHLDLIHVAMMGAAVFILVIACANVAALMLARGVTNRRDQALRLALGASRRDLLRDVTAEVSILAAAGGCIGLLVALAATGMLRAAMPPEMLWEGFIEPRWNARVFAGMFGAVMIAIGLAAAAPAWYTTRIAPAEPLKDGSTSTTGRPKKRFQLLVMSELALALILLVSASLIAKTVSRVTAFDFGYAARSVLEVTTPIRVVEKLTRSDSANVHRSGRTEITVTDLVDIVARLRSQPGVRDAAWVADDAAERDAVSSDATYTADSVLYRPRVMNVGPGFMATLGLPIVAGRDFVDGDRDSSGAAILDQASARRLFPDGDAVGRMVKLGPPMSRTAEWIPVVGIARDATHSLPDFPELPSPTVIYVSRARSTFAPSFVVRAAPGRLDVQNAAVRTVRNSLPSTTRVEGSSWAAGYVGLLQSRRFVGQIFATLGIASLVLATTGLFGVLSYVVSQRMREFAVRVALGAQRRNVVRLVLRDGLTMTLGGTAIGGLVGLAAGFALWDWLWGVYPIDAGALVFAETVLLTVTMLAAVLPALRATRANPADVMRAL